MAAIRERGTLFSAPMVRAILDDRKTQTRRIVTGAPLPKEAHAPKCRPPAFFDKGDRPVWTWMVGTGPNAYAVGDRTCRYGAPGDRLWVRETWAVDAPLTQVRRELEDAMPDLGHGPYFRADGVHENSGLTWRPSIHLPRWASRITLEITEVRVQRLQDITEDDARAEGVTVGGGVPSVIVVTDEKGRTTRSRGTVHDYTARGAFCHLWDGINGDRAPWTSNPWVWAISFRRVQ